MLCSYLCSLLYITIIFVRFLREAESSLVAADGNRGRVWGYLPKNPAEVLIVVDALHVKKNKKVAVKA